MKASRLLLLSLGLVAIALALWLWIASVWRGSEAALNSTGEVGVETHARAGLDPVAQVLTRQLSPVLPEASLPPVDTPLADTFDELVDRADSGDYRAACRLALELHVCDHDLSQLQFFAENARLHAHIDTDLIADDQLEQVEARMIFAQSQVDAFEATQAHCRGVPEVGMGRRLGWWRQSAVAGSRASVQELVGGYALPAHEWMRHTDHLAWQRRELEPLAWRAIHAGDLETAWSMMNAVMPQPDMMRVVPLAQATDVDGETALALAVYLEDALGSATGDAAAIEGLRSQARILAFELENSLPPEAQARALATSREWRRTITPLPVDTSPFRRHAVDGDVLESRRARMGSCSESRF